MKGETIHWVGRDVPHEEFSMREGLKIRMEAAGLLDENGASCSGGEAAYRAVSFGLGAATHMPWYNCAGCASARAGNVRAAKTIQTVKEKR